MSKNLSIEYGHIYTNQHIAEEHLTSLKVLSELKETTALKSKASSLDVMVDDYSFPDPHLVI